MVKAMSCLILTEMCTNESVPPAVAGGYNVYDSTDNQNTTRPLPQAVLTFRAKGKLSFLSVSPHGSFLGPDVVLIFLLELFGNFA